VRLDRGPWTFNWNTLMIGKASDAGPEQIGSNTNAAVTRLHKVHTEFTAYHAASVKYEMEDDWSVTVGVANLFDEHPPAMTTLAVGQGYSTAGRSVLASQYDYFGRRAFVNLTKSFR
jgi:iron complex outermembrane receptor protein